MEHENAAVTLTREAYDAVIFDLDGVITKTAKIHAAAWKVLFDEYGKHTDSDWQPFDPEEDYRRYVDGKPRYDGVRSFLKSRNIELPYGTPDDGTDAQTVYGLGNRKNEIFHDLLQRDGVEAYAPAIRLVKILRRHDFKTAIISSSKNCASVLETAGISDLFDTRVDGVVSEKANLKGKPAPDIFIEAARQLGAKPQRCVVVEDAIAGVKAGSQGHFGCVIGVDRTGHAEELREQGADIVITDLLQISVKNGDDKTPASALESIEEIRDWAGDGEIAVFLDYDGTLTPIVDSPEKALLSDEMRDAVIQLSRQCTVAVISGRDLEDVRRMVGIEDIFYAGSHGFDIAGPQDYHMEFQQGTDYLPALDLAEQKLKERLTKIEGILVERKKFSIAVHYRKVKEEDIEIVDKTVKDISSKTPELRRGYGKKVFELQPKIDWHKGKALLWVLQALDLDPFKAFPIYIGDDVTDEDAFRAIKGRGCGIVVMETPRKTEAGYMLQDTEKVKSLLRKLTEILKGDT